MILRISLILENYGDIPLPSSSKEDDAMTQIMIASGMSDGQIETAVEQFRAAMRKHRDEVQKEAVQQTLGMENLGMRMFAVFRELAEAVSNLVVRHVKVDRTKTPQQMLDATGRKQYTDADVVKSMPKGEGNEGDIFFFKPRPEAYDKNGLIRDDNLEKEFEFHGFKPCDPYKLAQVNADDPSFADERPNGTHWQDANGKWCHTAFGRWGGGRSVGVYRGGYVWYDSWWFAGLRK